MEQAKNIITIAEGCIAEFPDVDKFYLYIHILGFVSGFDRPLRFLSHSDVAPIINHFLFDKDLLQKIEKSLPIIIDEISEMDRKELCRYFLEKCLQTDRQIKDKPQDTISFFNQLSASDPQAFSSSKANNLMSPNDLSVDSFKQFIEWEIEKYFYYKTPRIPRRVCEKIVSFDKPKSWHTVYDPSCSDGALFVEFYNQFPDLKFTFNGIVGNHYERLFCLTNFYVNGIFDDKRIEFEIQVSSPLADEIVYFNRKDEFVDDLLRETADVSVSFVPYKMELTESERSERFFGLSYSLAKTEYSYIELMLYSLGSTGKAIAVVPNSVLSSSEGRFFREVYLSRDWIEGVFSLEKFSSQQSEHSEFSIVVFNKNKLEKGIVFFDGESSEFEKTEVTNDVILSENEVSLLPTQYALKDIKVLKDLIKFHQESENRNSAILSSEEIGLHQYFDNLAVKFAEEFPTVKTTVYLYLLLVVVMLLDRGSQWLLPQDSFLINPRIYNKIESCILSNYYNQLIDIVLGDLAKTNLLSDIKISDLILSDYGSLSNSTFKNAFRELCKYLLNKCLELKGNVKRRDLEGLWKEIAQKEPNAIQFDKKVKNNNFQELLEEISNSKFKHVQLGGVRALVNFSEFSDETYQELAESIIAQSFHFEENYLQGFNGLDKVLAKIANPKPNQLIFNPNCGIGSVFVELQKQYPYHNLNFTGRVDDNFFYILCKANLLAHNIEAFIAEDDALDPDIDYIFWDDLPDIAIGLTPLKIVLEGKRDSKFFKLTKRRNKIQYLFLELMINCIGQDGKAIVVVPEEFLYQASAKGFKENFLINDWIESVISISKDTFKEYRSAKTSIVVFNKNKTDKGFVTFKSQDEGFEETRVSVDEILSSDRLDLRVSRYARKEAKELQNLLSELPHPIKRIKELVSFAVSGRGYDKKFAETRESSNLLPFVRVSDLFRNDSSFYLDLSKIERKISRELVSPRAIIDYPAILVSKIAPNIRSAFFKFSTQPIVIGSDISALKIKEGIANSLITEYLQTQFHSRMVQIQVEIVSSGATVNRITEQDLLNIQIALPPLTEQRLQIFEWINEIEERAITKEAVVKAQQQADTIEYEVIANMNHSLKNKLGIIINDYDTLIRFLQRKDRAKLPVSFDETIRPVFDGENITDVDTVHLITERLKNNLLDTSNVFNTSLKLQTRKLNTTSVEFVDYFINEIRPLYLGQDFEIEIISNSKDKLNVQLDKDVFKDVVENLINNAKSHGFLEENNDYKIVFDFSKSEEIYDLDSGTPIRYARITYKNNGKAFPKGFSFNDYLRYSSKAGKTQGTGIGGAVIDKIIKLHNGKFNEIPVNGVDKFNIQFEILIPLDE